MRKTKVLKIPSDKHNKTKHIPGKEESYAYRKLSNDTANLQHNQTRKRRKNTEKGFSDVVSISNAGKDVSAAKAAVAASPDVRTELVDSIKSRIQAGTYDVSADDFADRLVAKFNGEF